MTIEEILADKQLKGKARVKAIGNGLLQRKVGVGELIKIAKDLEPSNKATCIEALEHAIRTDPAIGNAEVLNFLAEALADDAPRVKWESARAIGNIAHQFPTKLQKAVRNLLENAEHPGKVVRWSAAVALAEIVKLKTSQNKELVPAIESIMNRCEDESIKKIYRIGLKAVERKK